MRSPKLASLYTEAPKGMPAVAIPSIDVSEFFLQDMSQKDPKIQEAEPQPKVERRGSRGPATLSLGGASKRLRTRFDEFGSADTMAESHEGLERRPCRDRVGLHSHQ